MPRIPLTISLTPQLERFIADEVQSGRYGTASEVIRAALRLLVLARKREELDLGPLLEAQRERHRAPR